MARSFQQTMAFAAGRSRIFVYNATLRVSLSLAGRKASVSGGDRR
jgi:hypothetical protein